MIQARNAGRDLTTATVTVTITIMIRRRRAPPADSHYDQLLVLTVTVKRRRGTGRRLILSPSLGRAQRPCVSSPRLRVVFSSLGFQIAWSSKSDVCRVMRRQRQAGDSELTATVY